MPNNNQFLLWFLLLLTLVGVNNYARAQVTTPAITPAAPTATPPTPTTVTPSPAQTPIPTETVISNETVTPAPTTAVTNIPEFRNADILKSVWRPSGEMLSKCQQQGTNFRPCIISTMQAEGANPQAILFFQKTGGFANQIRKFRHVYVVYAHIPAADHTDGYFLVTTNGDFMDVDDPVLLNKIDITKAPLYSCLKANYSRAMLWPGYHKFPQELIENQKQRFVFNYPIKDGCNACALAGSADIAFDFNSNNGAFLGTKLLRVNVQGPMQS